MNARVRTPLQEGSVDSCAHPKPRIVREDSPSFVIREATEKDVDAIFDLICFKAEFDGCFSSVQATPRKLIAAMRGTSPYFRALLAEADGRPIGFASFHQTFSSFLAQPGIWLDDLFVRESHRGRGVDDALVRRLTILAARNGCARIDWIVATNNSKARDFNSRIGACVNEDVRHCRLDAEAIEGLASGTAAGAHQGFSCLRHEPGLDRDAGRLRVDL